MIARLLAAAGILAVSVAGFGLAGAGVADAHPLGNATVNHYDGLTIFPDRVVDDAVVDTAEIPTLQRAPLIDTDGDETVSPAEAQRYATARCADLAATATVTVGTARATLHVDGAGYAQAPGAAGLPVGRLECRLTGPADLSRAATVELTDTFDSAGIGGWHEITAVGSGTTLQGSPVPAASISDALRHYPSDLLSSPLDVRTARIATVPGPGVSSYGPIAALPGADAVLRGLDDLSRQFNTLVGSRDLTPGVALAAVLLSVALGAGHAFLPGHGKTIMAAYLVGKRGRLRDVVTVGATVTVTHTVGVLVLGLALTASAALVPTAVEQVLAVISGLLVAGVGVGLLVTSLRRSRTAGLEVVKVPAGVVAGHGHGHGHEHEHEPHGFGRGGLVGLGVAGGLVPSPSALLVLLAAIALGRTWLGIVLVLAYGLGMAGALTAAGLLLVRLQDRIAAALARPGPARTAHRLRRIATHLPVLTAVLVVLVGAGLVLRALSGSV